MKKEEKTIAIIGGGNLGMAIAEGLIKSQFVTPQQITITRRNVELLGDGLMGKTMKPAKSSPVMIPPRRGSEWVIRILLSDDTQKFRARFTKIRAA